MWASDVIPVHYAGPSVPGSGTACWPDGSTFALEWATDWDSVTCPECRDVRPLFEVHDL